MRVVLVAVVLAGLALSSGCGLVVWLSKCDAQRDCDDGRACVDGACVQQEEPPLPDAGAVDAGLSARDAGSAGDAAVLDGGDGGDDGGDGGDGGEPDLPCGSIGALPMPWSASAGGWPWGLAEVDGGTWELLDSAGGTVSLGSQVGAEATISTGSFAYSVVRSRVALRVAPLPAGVEARFEVHPWGGSGLALRANDGTLTAHIHDDDGALTHGAQQPYDADEHRWWQARHDGVSVYLETSPDGTSWDVVAEAVSPAYAERVVVTFGATRIDATSDAGGMSDAGEAVDVAFSSFVVEPAGGSYCPLSSLVEDFQTLPADWRRIEADSCVVESVAGAVRITHPSTPALRCGLASLTSFTPPAAGNVGEVTLYGADVEGEGALASVYLWDLLSKSAVYFFVRSQHVEAYAQGPSDDPSWEQIGEMAAVPGSADLRFGLLDGTITFSFRRDGEAEFEPIGTQQTALSDGPLLFGFVLRDAVATFTVEGINAP